MFGINIDYERRIFGFDLLRAFAIFCVVHGHARHLLNNTILEAFPYLPLPHGVDIFFVLSGFLICNSFLQSVSRIGNSLQKQQILAFWKRTALRILPNYYLILIVNYCLVYLGILPGRIDSVSIWKFITFTQNLWYPFYDFFWESWSLAVQIWFYLLFPILLFCLCRFMNMKRSLFVVSILFIILPMIYRVVVSGKYYDQFWWDVVFRKVVISRIDCIFLESLLHGFVIITRSIGPNWQTSFFFLGLSYF